MSFLPLIAISVFSPLFQIITITILFIAIVLVQYRVFKKRGTFSHNYPPLTLTLFAPIYEEVLFRGILLAGLISLYNISWAIIISSVLFGVWHIRSLFFMPVPKVISQILWTGLFLGPLFAIITIYTGSIWIAVIIHFLNNLFAPIAENHRFFKR